MNKNKNKKNRLDFEDIVADPSKIKIRRVLQNVGNNEHRINLSTIRTNGGQFRGQTRKGFL